MIFRRAVKALILVGFVGVAFGGTGMPLIQSSEPIGLDSLVALGLRNNPDVRNSEYLTKLNNIGNLAAVGRFLPSISLGLNFSQSEFENRTYVNPDGSVSSLPVTTQEEIIVWDDSTGQLVLDTIEVTRDPSEGKSRSSSYSLSADLNLFRGGQDFFLYRIATAQRKINTLSVEEAHKSLTRSIAQQMMGILTAEKVKKLNERLRDQRKDAFDLATARFEVGAVTELDVLQAEIELGTAENAIKSSERETERLRELLNQTLGIDLKSRFPMEDTGAITPYSFELDALVGQAYRNRSDLEIAVLRAKQSQNYVNYSRGAYLPSVNIGAQKSNSEQSGVDEAFTLNPRNKDTSYFLSLRWNLFDGFAREYDIQSRKVDHLQAMESERKLRLSVEQAVRDAYRNLQTVYEQLQTTNRNRDLANRTMELERERYRLGATSALALRDAQVTYERAETDHLSKELEYQSSLIALELAVGKGLR